MKLLKIMLLFVVVFSMVQCQDETELETPITNQDKIPEEILAKIAHMGFNTTDIPVEAGEGGYTVEGDIFITSEEVESIDFSKQKYERLASCSRSRDIKVKNDLPNGTIKRTVASAIRNWNRVNGSFLRFRLVNRGADIVIRSDRGILASDVLGRGTFPSNNRVGNLIIINTDYRLLNGNAPNFQQWRSSVQHEFGHNIGFAHTNESLGTLVPGTPNRDPNSLMNGRRGGTVQNLTANDRRALNRMYGGNASSNLCQ